MVVQTCQHEQTQKHGKDRHGNQRHKCKRCGATFTEAQPKPLGALRISMRQATTALGMMLEGMSLRAINRLTGIDRETLGELILTVGENCQALLDSLEGIEASDVEADEIWSFVGLKEKRRIDRNRSEELGDSWCWIAVEANTKLVLAHHVGDRDSRSCWSFLTRLRRATAGRFQLSSDGLAAYRMTVPFVFRGSVDFTQLVKQYASTHVTTRYSPATIIGAEKHSRMGGPDLEKTCTSHVKRLNLSLRMHLRRFTRLTNGHSKSLDHHKAMLAIFFAWYNFARVNTGLEGKQTPAIATGLTTKAWSLRELLENAATKNFGPTH
ncbi:MAG: IS1 family transposase [Planctomycetota bacterium]